MLLALKGVSENVFAGGLPPLKGLMDTFLRSGGKLLVCAPCVAEREMEAHLIEGSKLIAGARVTQESNTAAAVLDC